MHPSRLCIVPRLMTRVRALHAITLLVMIVAIGGCDSLDGRNRNRKGNRDFRETKFIDAATEYETALKTVDDPIIHYNLGLAYSKMYRAGASEAVLLGQANEPVCSLIPGVKQVDARVCIKKMELRTDEKETIRRYPECNEKDICPSSYDCKQTKMCAAGSPALADMAASHFHIWIKAQPSDDDLKAKLKVVREKFKAAEASGNEALISEIKKQI